MQILLGTHGQYTVTVTLKQYETDGHLLSGDKCDNQKSDCIGSAKYLLCGDCDIAMLICVEPEM